MPYKSIEAAKADKFPVIAEGINMTLAQINKLAAIHDAIKKAGEAEVPMAVAWDQWKELYMKKGEAWVEREQSQKMISHDAILQTLNRRVGGYCFPTDVFAKSVEAWEGIPLVFADNHPDQQLFSADPDTALDEIKGQIVGKITQPHIATEGHPRLMGKLMNNNAEVAALIEEGRASISTGFQGAADEDAQILNVVPNHVLIFREGTGSMPKDHGAFILNKEEFIEFTNAGEIVKDSISKSDSHINDINEQEFKNMEEVQELANKLGAANKELGDVSSKLDIANKELETVKATITEKDGAVEVLNKETEALKSTIEGHETTIKEFKQKEADALIAQRDKQWDEVAAGLPVGLTHKEEDVKALRTEWDADPHGFSAKYIPICLKEPAKGESGDEHTGSGDGAAQNTSGVYTPGEGYK